MCDFSDYPPIHYPYLDSPERQIEGLLSEARSHIDHGRLDEARSILIAVQRTCRPGDTTMTGILDELWDQCGHPRLANVTPYNEESGATNPDNNPYNALDQLAIETGINKKTNNPRKIALRDGFKEKMMNFIYLTQRNHWYKRRNSDQDPAYTDVYYWFGTLLDYRFDNKTGKLIEEKNKQQISALAQEVYDFSQELKKMAEEAFKHK